ncbi:hypothetical protein COCMIDRAFT_29638 [Bipolaris oryzae ATCC 44560]|uniref:Uncharacterized protein n=1 Tax=Bipolaris oryzae ATCC 44560 TaxID=930090 RepID=W6YVP9_COCMI|nr:uncharacterized protein COCMIDRAFT_29638 [Bipolaris oryzae ATCC 44560]EUC41620.1 hypothetical protein COCMIDRAFT_29638 [Bipolaris oryzae ATCC 44560]
MTHGTSARAKRHCHGRAKSRGAAQPTLPQRRQPEHLEPVTDSLSEAGRGREGWRMQSDQRQHQHQHQQMRQPMPCDGGKNRLQAQHHPDSPWRREQGKPSHTRGRGEIT